MIDSALLGVYIFGSVGRRQQDDLSDLDILAVVRNGAGKVPDARIAHFIPANLQTLKLSISWYGATRLQEMFCNGELFAWHLHRETLPLYDPIKFLHELGKPESYRDAIADSRSFQKVLEGIPSQVQANANNAIYEAGLVYVCLRNAAMAASWSLCKSPDFTRYSPFRLEGIRPCPISRDEFDVTMACRMAGQRGKVPPSSVDAAFVLDVYRRLEPWIEELCRVLEKV